jgi:N-acetylmuramic acid 6-phosphate etherase
MLDNLLTEQSNHRTAEIDRLDIEEALRRINEEDEQVARAVRREIPRIAGAVEMAADAMRKGGRLIYVGAGTSGRLGCLDAAEIPPTFGEEPGRVVGIIAGGERALRRAVEGAEDDPSAGEAALREAAFAPPDLVCGLAASGRTPFVLGALAYARSVGCGTIGVANSVPAEMEPLCDVFIAPLVGPEVISGSTRLKAGTAQKLVLNMLSTMAMVRLGKTYGNLMVDVRPTNEKLRYRAAHLVATVGGVGEALARELLQATGGEVKPAIVMARGGGSPGEARERLRRAEGSLRRVIGDPEG